MDEQTIQQSAYDVSADGAVNAVSAEESLPLESEETLAPKEELASDGIRVSDGELEIGDKFFVDMPEEPEAAKSESEKPYTPNWYTDEELKATPFESWDTSRLNGDIGRFAPIVQGQLRERAMQRNAQAVQESPMPSDIVEPKQYTPKELADESLKLACEKLGLSDPEDFDAYDGEHNAAMELARQELLSKRNAEISGYQTAVQGWQANQRLAAELLRQPDYQDFTDWYVGKCREYGTTPEQVNAELYKIARNNGNRFDLIGQTIGKWYMEFRQSRSRPEKTTVQADRKRNPAVLESSRGNNYNGIHRVAPHDFRDMTPDEQAEALIQMGYV